HTARMKWQAVNCLYAGWRSLLMSADTPIEEIAAWQSVWGRNEGDVAVALSWPTTARQDPCEASADEYRPLPAPDSPVAFAGTSDTNPGPLGCALTALPPLRTNWLLLASGSYPTPVLDPIDTDKPPSVPTVEDGKYHGGRIDLASTPDLGAFLDDMHRSK